ncbi:MAG: hypothetical protein BWY19_00505 [bacterium ADurb.Bin212]|nr:MAG: hypothetical protein BWY19_00505 [bacterium ADurb.Bin212]
MIKYFKIFRIILINAYLRDSIIGGVIIFNLVISLLEIIMTIILFNIIFANVTSLAGWNYYQVLFIFSMMKLTSVLSGLIYRKGLGKMANEMVRMGDYDFHLAKPVNPMIMVSLCEPKIYQIITLFAVVTLAIFSAIKSTVAIPMINIIFFGIFFILGQILFYFLSVISIVPTFWFVRLYSLYDVMNRFLQFARYPAGIYSNILKAFLFVVFPVLAVTYIPAWVLFNPIDYRYAIYMVLVTVFFGFIATKLWRLGEKHYGSASS